MKLVMALICLGICVGLSSTATASPHARTCIGDVSGGDGIVGLNDLAFIQSSIGSHRRRADLNCNGVVDESDTKIELAFYGGCYTCPGDVNGDGVVSSTDLRRLRNNFGSNYTAADFDNNGVVDLSDLAVLLSNYHGVCKQVKRCACPDLNADGVVDLTDLATLLSQVGTEFQSKRIKPKGAFSLVSESDFNRDGIIDERDVDYLTAFFGQECKK